MTGDPTVAPPPAAREVFGDRLGLAQAYAGLLAVEGTEWGLLGPREAQRVWGRHLLNSASLRTLVPPDVQVLDIGSGAVYPGSRSPSPAPTSGGPRRAAPAAL